MRHFRKQKRRNLFPSLEIDYKKRLPLKYIKGVILRDLKGTRRARIAGRMAKNAMETVKGMNKEFNTNCQIADFKFFSSENFEKTT